MQKKLTITINEQIYEGLYRLVGPRKISGFIEDLVRPHVLYPDLERAYAELTQNTAREGAASEWTSGDTTMVRKQVYLKSQKDMQVKKLAAERGTTETDIIREAVDLLLSEVARQRRAQQAWEEARAFMEDRFAQKQMSGERTWTREELYAERLERYEKYSD